ncbi:YncE family protein [Streptomyces sp. NPDC054841]
MNDTLAVVSQSGPTVTFFDAGTYERLGILELPSEPHELCFDAARRLLYCTITYRSGYYHANSGRAHELAVIDPDTRRLIDVVDLSPDHAPHGLALDAAHDLLYVSVEERAGEGAGAGAGGRGPHVPGGVVVLDLVTRKPVRRIPVLAPGPHWFAITPDGRYGYSANKEAPYVTVVDLESGEMLERIEVPGSEGIAVSPDGRQVYVAAPKGDFGAGPVKDAGVRVIDTETGRIIRTLRTEGAVFPVHATADGLVLAGELRMSAPTGSALGTQLGGMLHVYVPGGDKELGRVPTGAFPLTITSSPDGAFGYVANVSSSTVTVVDLARLRVVTTLEVARAGEPGAHGLAYIPARIPAE